ncbi:mannose/glucose-specific lectin-like [Lolium rigidum]|uniref:mannose/glucose-specific lectin-like n=1 Tax=Lolium rigidum TaxID=89674 RepID=UPI001F5E0F0B|nr:mannose/glucose-specific lectin-like [Lolium rigidum]
MAATNPSYYQSGLCQEIKQKDHSFQLYMFQHVQTTPGENQLVIVNPPNTVKGFGVTAANDWTIRDGPDATANVVARARGFHIADGKADTNWLFCHSILFTDARFKGSSLKVLGDYAGIDSEWAIVGGTGEFAYAHGVVTAKTPITKMGPWGGNGGTTFDIIPEEPRSLQDVTIKCGDVINSVAFSYTNQAGQTKTAGPWGGDGALTVKVTLASLETIKQIQGTTDAVGGDTVVTSLTLISNLRAYGPFGKTNGTPFSSQVPDENIITGFYARTGGSVNALGVYACPK